MRKLKQKRIDDTFLSSGRFGRALADNLSWGVNRLGRKVQLCDQDGFVFDLDRKGRIVRMRDNEGRKFKCR